MPVKKKTWIEIKIELAEKCEHLASLAGSAAKRKHFLYRANRLRRQAAEKQRVLNGRS